MILMWSCFVLAVVSGALYQYLAAKHLERHLPRYTFKVWGWLPLSLVYSIMLTAFYGGTLIFTLYAIVGITHLAKSK